jgi:inosose dehydratase
MTKELIQEKVVGPTLEALLKEVKVGNAPCSFGIMSGFEPDPPLTYLDVLDQIAEAGYAGTELGDWGFMPGDPAVLQPELELRNLALTGAFTPVELTESTNLEAATATALRAARLLATCASPDSAPGPYVILAADASLHPHRRRVAGRVKPQDGLAPSEWHALTGNAQHVARAVADETGVRTVFHPHCATPIETFEEITRFVEMTAPDLIGLCYDTGHIAYAGDDPVGCLSQLRDRIQLVHFKDMDLSVAESARKNEWEYGRAVREGLYCELGRGSVDWFDVKNTLLSAGYQGWIIVEDELPPGRVPPLEAAKRDREFLRGQGL